MIIIAGYNHADKDAMMGEVTVIPRGRHGSEPPISFRHSSQFWIVTVKRLHSHIYLKPFLLWVPVMPV